MATRPVPRIQKTRHGLRPADEREDGEPVEPRDVPRMPEASRNFGGYRERIAELEDLHARLVADRDRWHGLAKQLVIERDSDLQAIPADITAMMRLMEVWLGEWAGSGNKHAVKDLARLRGVMKKYRLHPAVTELPS